MPGRNIYQATRTVVKKQLNHVVELLDMEYAITASSPLPIDEVETALGEYLAEHGFHVVDRTDVTAIHEHYNLEYPEYRILKVANAERLADCPMVNAALDRDPGMGVFLPPSVVLYELGGETRISAIRPSTLLALFNDPAIHDVIQELEGVLWDALAEGIPDGTMSGEEPPVRADENQRRGQLKKALFYVLRLVDAEYSIHVSSDRPRERVEAELRDALARRGQHVLGEVRDGHILLVVNPGQAHMALAIDPDFGVFAPLSIAIDEVDGRTHVRAVRPTTLLIFFTQPALQDILGELELLLWNSLVAGVPNASVHSRQPPLPPGTGQSTNAGGLPGELGSAMDR